MRKYVLGFYFHEKVHDLVLLLRRDKNKPILPNTLNGFGGEIEDGETPAQAMTREFAEESGIEFDEWKDLFVFSGEDYVVHCFYGTGDFPAQGHVTSEGQCIAFFLSDLPSNMVDQLALAGVMLAHQIISQRIIGLAASPVPLMSIHFDLTDDEDRHRISREVLSEMFPSAYISATP